MHLLCPVCNGLQTLHVMCPRCRQLAADYGRSDDYLGPYSPYRSIDDLKMTNGYPDLALQQCVHIVYCESCDYSFSQQIHEWID